MTKLRILQVEDDQSILDISRIALEIVGGFEVHQFRDGADAVAGAESIDADVFLLDVTMHGMSGEETLLALRGLPACRDVPAIFMTAHWREDEIARLRGLGVIEVLLKPFDPMRLAEQIARALPRR